MLAAAADTPGTYAHFSKCTYPVQTLREHHVELLHSARHTTPLQRCLLCCIFLSLFSLTRSCTYTASTHGRLHSTHVVDARSGKVPQLCCWMTIAFPFLFLSLRSIQQTVYQATPALSWGDVAALICLVHRCCPISCTPSSKNMVFGGNFILKLLLCCCSEPPDKRIQNLYIMLTIKLGKARLF